MKPDLWKSINLKAFLQDEHCGGFTLLEVIIVIIITGFVTASIVTFSASEMIKYQPPVIQVKELLKLSRDAEAALADYAALPLENKNTFTPTQTKYSTYNSEDSDAEYQTTADETDDDYTISDTGSTLTFNKLVLENSDINFRLILLFANI